MRAERAEERIKMKKTPEGSDHAKHKLPPGVRRRAEKEARLVKRIVGRGRDGMHSFDANLPFWGYNEKGAHTLEAWITNRFFVDCRDDVMRIAAKEARRLAADLVEAANRLEAESKRIAKPKTVRVHARARHKAGDAASA